MAGETPAAGKELVWKTIELVPRFLPDEDTPEIPLPDAPEPDPRVLPKGFLDPVFDRAATARLFWRLDDGEAMEIPFRDPQGLAELLEFEFVLSGAEGVQKLINQLDHAALQVLTEADFRPQGSAFSNPAFAGGPPPVHRAIRVLMDMQSGRGRGVLEAPPAYTDDLVLLQSPARLHDLLLEADNALTPALESLWEASREALRQVETAARGILAMSLDSARNEIFQEALRYFRFDNEEGVQAALERVKHPMAKAEDDARAGKAADVRKMPVHNLPARLQNALKDLKPLAEDLIKKRKAVEDAKPKADPMDSFQLITIKKPVPPEKIKAAEAAAQTLAKELGKLREAHPVALRLTPEDLLKAPSAARDVLGAILFPILARAYQANRKVREEMEDWPDAAGSLQGVHWPGSALAARLREDPSIPGIWRHRKYVERAISLVFPEAGGLGHEVANQVLETLHGTGSTVEVLGGLIRDLAIFQVAEGADKARTAAAATAAEFGARKLPRFVPILNWAYAGHSIYKLATEYLDNRDYYFCTLDPRDALSETEPRLGELLGGVATEIAFALV